MSRLLRDRSASVWAKILVALAILYVVFPLDFVPDIATLVGYLDDIGLVMAVRLVLHRQMEPYRYPLFGPPPPRINGAGDKPF